MWTLPKKYFINANTCVKKKTQTTKNWHQMMNILISQIQCHFQDYNESKVLNPELCFQILLSLINLVSPSMILKNLMSGISYQRISLHH